MKAEKFRELTLVHTPVAQSHLSTSPVTLDGRMNSLDLGSLINNMGVIIIALPIFLG